METKTSGERDEDGDEAEMKMKRETYEDEDEHRDSEVSGNLKIITEYESTVKTR